MKSSHTRKPLHQQGAEQSEQPFFSKKQEEAKKKDDVFFQTKLAVGDKNDKQEKEANAVGDKVQKKAEEEKEKPAVQKKEEEKKEPGIQKMDKKDEEKPVQKMAAADEKDKDKNKVNKKEEEKKEPGIQKMEKKEEEKPVQKMSEGDKKEEKAVQKKEAADDKKDEQVMTAAKTGGPAHTAHKASVEERIRESKGKGYALPDDIRKKMEAELKVDLGLVRIHTDAEAISMNRELHSLAFTNGFDIYFNEGQYLPYSTTGQGLIAHELTHVIQQTGISQKPSSPKK